VRACGGGASLYAGAGLGQGWARAAPPRLHPGQQEGALARRRDLQRLLELLHEVVHVEVLVRRHDVLPRPPRRVRCAPASRRAGAHAAQVACNRRPIKLYRVAESKLLGSALRKHPQAGAEHMCCLVRQHPAPPNKLRSATARPGRTGRRTPPQAAMEQGAGGAGRAPSSARPGRSWPGARPGRGPPPAGTARRTWP